jgi:adenosylcobinamide kinase/adenosylcobinamide-phosphate guanylyltransferase
VTVTLVTGGVRSGKSRYAEALLRRAAQVTYVATGAVPDGDSAWADRVARHRQGRPSGWSTRESLDLPPLLAAASGPVLVDCLGTWLTGLVDRAGLWDDHAAAAGLVAAERDTLIGALRACPHDVVLVTNEVGFSLVADTPSGRFFQDELGRVNASVADVADRVVLVVAGRVLDLTGTPRVSDLGDAGG